MNETTGKDNRLLVFAVIFLVALISIVAFFKAQPILFPKVAQSASVDPQCDLRSAPCISSIGDEIRIGFSIEPRDIPVVKPLHFKVQIEGLVADKVEVDFAGVDMNMGFNRVRLTPRQQGIFEGEGMLPVCVRDAMEWEAKVLITTQAGIVSAPYRFITLRPGVLLPR
jgi:hypothetical protein